MHATRYAWLSGCCLAVLATVTTTGHAQTLLGQPSADPTEITWQTSLESWKLPADQRVGMAGLNMLVGVSENLRLGVGAYAAVSGEYGGLTVLGLTGQWHQNIHKNWGVQASLFAGGGGGVAGYDLTGNGFVFRSDAALTYELGNYGRIGAGLSWVTFPSGEIRSAQPYLSYQYSFGSAAGRGWANASPATSTPSVAAKRQELALGYTYYNVPNSVTTGSGGKQDNIEMAGVRWTSYLDDNWFASLQADASYTGSTSGYTQLLGGAGYRLPLGSSTGIKLYALAGAGGAGNDTVDTGGGLLLGGGLALQQQLTRHWAVEVGAGGLAATSGNFKAWTLGINLSYVFGTPSVDRSTTVQRPLAGYEPKNLQVRVMNQTFFKADDNWRNNDDINSVNNLGLALDYHFNPNLYLTGQGLVAYTGNSRSDAVTAVSELTGLLGVGWQQSMTEHWFVKAEGLLGASVGGTMDTGNGAVWQVNAGIGYQLTPDLSVSITGGRMQAMNGQFKANILNLALGWRFNLPMQ